MPRSGTRHTTPGPRSTLTNLLAVWGAEEAWQRALPSPHPLFNTRNYPYWPVHEALLRQIADTPAASAAEALGKFRVLCSERSDDGYGIEGALQASVLRDAEHLGVMPPVGSEAPDADWPQRLDAVRGPAASPVPERTRSLDPERKRLLGAAREVCKERGAIWMRDALNRHGGAEVLSALPDTALREIAAAGMPAGG